MKSLKTSIFCLILLLISLLGKAQTPAHFKLGEEELSGIDIYDILQDKDRNYWLATDNGIIKYDGYTFKNIKCNNALSNSVFDLKLDYNNVLYCKNLSGQIFQIKDDSCKLYFQIPDSLMYKNVHYAFDNNNELIIATNAIFKVKENKTTSIFEKKNVSYTGLITLKDSSILLHRLGENKLLTLKNGRVNEEKIQHNSTFFFLDFLMLNEKIQYYNRATSELLIKDSLEFIINKNFNPAKNKDERLRYYTTKDILWVARQSGGVIVYDTAFTALFNETTIFENNIISTVFKDNEGNTLLGTFGDGLIVLPNMNLVDVNISNRDIKYTRITSTPENTIFIGTQNGNVFQIDSNLVTSLIWDKKNKNIEVLDYLEEENSLLIDGNKTFLYQLNTNIEHKLNWGAIKDVVNISDKNYLFASSSGVYNFNFNISNYQHTKTPINKFTGRTNCVGYNPKTKTIYAGTSSGLKIGDKTKADFFLLNGNTIICKDILYFNNQVYVVSQKNGIFIFENEKLIDNWNEENGFPTNTLKHIKHYNNQLYFSSDKGIIITNTKGEVFSILNKSEGLYSNQIIDFEIRNDILWLIHQKGVQKININSLSSFNCTPTIAFHQILINDTINSNIHDEIYSYQQNKFEFHLSANSLKFKNEIQYLHQLIGIDNGWQTNNYDNHKVEYKSLPPGNYVFQVKAKCRDKESEVLFYKFKITHPFWNRWWFYVLIILFFISTTYLIYKQEIKKQRKKIQLKNELNASKLIAIQSQMNPHFIFNAINSIQDLILKGDIDNSYSYIIKFAKLVRQTLNFSDKEFIDIEDEIELLKIYLELEKLRFKDDFEYSINCEVDDIQVPPMLIQPFVENAIKHGLLHKKGLKKLTITFSKDEILHCTITDNGIGRKKAQEITDRRQKSHQSFSVNATQSRFEIMKSHYQQDLGVIFEDLYKNNLAIGTSVIVNMPFKQNY